MRITVEGKTYQHDENRLNVSEAILLEQLTGMTFMQWQEGLGAMSPLAMKGLVYLIKVRAGEQPDWLSLDFNMAAIDVQEDEAVEVPPTEVEPAA